MLRHLTQLFICSVAAISLCGCADFGPNVVRVERSNYNSAIHDTNAQQLLNNMVRAHFFEDPTFVNFAEADSNPMAGASITGGSENLGDSLVLGSLSPTFSISETAIQKHVSVTGYELIQQISTPITLRNIDRFENSNSPSMPLLEMSVNRLGRRFVAYDRIVHLLYLLDLYGATVIEARNENTLTISLSRDGIVHKQLRSDPNDEELSCVVPRHDDAVGALWAELTRLLDAGGRGTIVLRSPEAKIVPDNAKLSELAVANKGVSEAVVLTRSALGALRLAEDHSFTFTSPEQASAIRAENREARPCFAKEFYILPSSRMDQESVATLWGKFHQTNNGDNEDNILSDAREIGSRTALILVQTSPSPLPAAYVSVERRGIWYSIADDDETSKRNFSLLNSLQIIQAMPSANSPTPTTISANPGGK